MTNSYQSLFRCRGSNTIYVYGEITLFHCLGRVGGFRDFVGLGTLSTRYASAGNRRKLVDPGCYNGDCRTGRGGGGGHKKISTEVKANSPSPSEHYYQAVFDQSPSFIHRVLTPFGQVESDLWRKFDGTGLGLPLAKSLAERHGGTLNLNSRTGSGTTVTIEFPPQRLVA